MLYLITSVDNHNESLRSVFNTQEDAVDWLTSYLSYGTTGNFRLYELNPDSDTRKIREIILKVKWTPQIEVLANESA